MRGVRLACCFAACSLALIAGSASIDAAPSASRPASAYLDGTWFDASVDGPLGPVSASGAVVDRMGFVSDVGPPGERLGDLRDFSASVPLTADLSVSLGYRVDDLSRLNGTNAGYDGLFLTPATGFGNSWFSGANYASATWSASDNLHFTLGAATSAFDPSVIGPNAFDLLGRSDAPFRNVVGDTGSAMFAGASWNATRWMNIDVAASQMQDRSELLGNSLAPGYETNALSVSARLRLGGGWMTTATVGEALTKLDVKPSALNLSSWDDLHREGYSLAIAKHGVFGDDSLGIAVSRPADDGIGSAFAFATSQSNMASFGPGLTGDPKQETDFEVGYVTNFLNDSVALQTNASYQMNFTGQNGNNAISLFSRAKIKF